MPNSPYLDKSLHWKIRTGQVDMEEPRFKDVAEAIATSGLATEVVRPLSGGKEAEVYLCLYKGTPIAIKAYRLFRTSHRGGGLIKAEALSWRAAHEFDLLLMAFRGGAPVPAPARRVEQMFSMRYLGDDEPAPRLKDVELDNPEVFIRHIISGVEGLAAAGVVHGDLSPFNILVFQGCPWFIDLSEGIRVDRMGFNARLRRDRARRALTHGLGTLRSHFDRYGVEVPVEETVARIVASFRAPGLHNY